MACILQVECLSEFTTFEQGRLGKKVDASTAPTSGTESAEYWVQSWVVFSMVLLSEIISKSWYGVKLSQLAKKRNSNPSL